MGKNNKPRLIRGKLRFVQDDNNGVCYANMLTNELFEIKDYDILNTRAKAFSRKVNAFLVNDDKEFKDGDYIIQGGKIYQLLKAINRHRAIVKFIKYFTKPKYPEVWDIVSGRYMSATAAAWLEKEKGYTASYNVKTNPDDGTVELRQDVKLSKLPEGTIEVFWSTYPPQKIIATTDTDLDTRRFKDRQIKHIIVTDGELRDIQVTEVPNGFIKIKSQKRRT